MPDLMITQYSFVDKTGVEGESEKQDDAADTVIDLNAAQSKVEQVNNTEEVEVRKLKIKATISFKQLLESEIEK